MPRKPLSFDDLCVRTHHLWNRQWLLLSVGDFAAGRFNAMTVGWGSLGTMWSKPFAQVVVRPTRHTYGFMEQYDSFTLCAFPDRYHKSLQLMGTKSGRDGDKIAAAGLTPVASTQVAAPGFAEANLVIECCKMYWQDMEPAHFLDPDIDKNYVEQDYHRIYFGEIVAILGEGTYAA